MPSTRKRLGLLAGLTVLATAAVSILAGTGAVAAPAGTQGQDVSSYQGSVNWQAQWNAGSRFAYIKATEGTYYTNASFAQQYNGSYNVGMIRGAYHFARPDTTSGATQADYFVNHGGGWSKDGRTLPGALDIEYNPYGAECYGLSQASMRSWITSFSNEYHARTTRWPVLYTTTDWWNTCIGNYNAWAANSPLWIARYASTVGTLPPGYSVYSFWQWSSAATLAGDSDVWNGTLDRLKVMACNGTC
jgi:GH25 family lysozyme M1 (1,4-beta-N-acetylmuramidase)